MDSIVDGIVRFRNEVYPGQRSLYRRLAQDGQTPKALMISCSDSRVMPEVFTQSDPGDIFVARNAGNIVPPYGTADGAVTSAIEYAVIGLKVQHIIVCGHSDCGAMKALLAPEALNDMPAVASWLRHCTCSHRVFAAKHGELDGKEGARALAMENVVVQLQHLQTHPCVAARLADKTLALHGWFFDIEAGTIFALDGRSGTFSPVVADKSLPLAVPREGRPSFSSPCVVAAE